MTAPMQLVFDGGEVTIVQSRPKPLTDEQRKILAHVRVHGSITSELAGTIIHESRGYCPDGSAFPRFKTDGRCCKSVATGGGLACSALARRGLLVRDLEGFWIEVKRD